MPSFTYVARDPKGKAVQGVLDAANQQEVLQKLRKDNLFVTQINSSVSSIERSKSSSTTKMHGRVAIKEKMFFAKQFYVMLKAGLGMTLCLNNLYTQTENKYFQYVIGEVRREVEGGRSLSEAMASHPKVFDKMFVHMTEAGEASGKLETSFLRMGEYFEREYKLRKEVIGSMTYPVIIVVVAILAVMILMIFIMPQFTSMFKGAGKSLPMLTQVVMGISDGLRQFWYLIPVVPVGGYFGYKAMRQNPQGSAALDKFWLTIPVFGDLLKKLAVSRFTKTLATLLDSGVPILQSLEIVQKAVNNDVVAQGIRQATLAVSRGSSLSKPLADSGIFPPMVSQMVSIGEESGDIARLLNEVSDYYDKEVGYAVENMTTMIEPMVIVVIGAVVGVIVLSIYLPMFELSSGGTL